MLGIQSRKSLRKYKRILIWLCQMGNLLQYDYDSHGRRKQCEAAGAVISKVHLLLSHHLSERQYLLKLYCMDTRLLVAIMGLQTSTLIWTILLVARTVLRKGRAAEGQGGGRGGNCSGPLGSEGPRNFLLGPSHLLGEIFPRKGQDICFLGAKYRNLVRKIEVNCPGPPPSSRRPWGKVQNKIISINGRILI
jgi:hypothetical protein